MIKIIEQNGQSNVSFTVGAINSENAANLKVKINELIENGCKKIEVDVSHLTYIDSPGIYSLISIRERMHKESGEILLIGLDTTSDQVRNTFSIW